MYLLACNICAYVVSLEIELHIIQICLYVVIVIKLSYTNACIDQLRVTFNQERMFTNVSLHFLNTQNYLIILKHQSRQMKSLLLSYITIFYDRSSNTPDWYHLYYIMVYGKCIIFWIIEEISWKKWNFYFNVHKNICAMKTSIRFEFHHTCSTRKGYARQIIVNIGGNIMLIQFE